MAENTERREVEININTNAEQTAESIRKLQKANINLEESALKLEKANKDLAQSEGKTAEEIKRLELAQRKAKIAHEEAQDAVKKLSETQKKATKSTKDMVGGLDAIPGPVGKTVSGFKDLIKSMWALVANPIGAVLAAIVVVVGALGKAFLSTEGGSNKLNKGIAIVSGAFSGLMKILEPVASFIVDGIVKGFEMAGNALLFTANLFKKGLQALGFDDAAKGLDNLTKSVQNNIKASKQLADAEAELQRQQRLSTKVQLDYQKQAEKIRQQRDDENNSIAKRIQLNNQLGELLQKQLNEELRIANEALKVANLRIKLEGKSTANLDARAEALTNISDIQERLSGQESEQLANLNSLRNEQLALDKERQAEKDRLAKEQFDKDFAFAQQQAELVRKIQADKLEADRLFREQEQAELDAELEADIARIKKRADEEKAIAEAVQTQKEEIKAKEISLAERGVALIAQIFGKSKKVQKAAMIAESATSISKQVAANNAANIGALATPQAIATSGASAVPVIALNNVSTGIGIASTIASTAKALQSLGGGSAPSVSGGGQVQGGGTAPQVSFQASSENQIANATANNINNQQPIQAYVVESEVTTAQSLANNRITANSL
jgi:hypothetical protein